jgi:hypothetical protein
LQDLRSNVNTGHVEIVAFAIATIQTLRDSRDSYGNVSELQLQRFLMKLKSGDLKGAIPIEVKAQNAGIFITRNASSIAFESFELSPTNTAAMTAKGRLVRTFPAAASKVAFSDMASNALTSSLACTSSKLAAQVALGMQPVIRKNGHNMKEERDTTDPAMVTDFLMNLIAAHGDTAEAARITKNTREDVLWNNCLKPWRRSPLWLLIRVSLQLLFTRNGVNMQPPDCLYKAFMVQLLSRLLDRVSFVQSSRIYVPNVIYRPPMSGNLLEAKRFMLSLRSYVVVYASSNTRIKSTASNHDGSHIYVLLLHKLTR